MAKDIQLFLVGLKGIVSDELHIFGPWTNEVAQDLLSTMETENGVGVAAPQIGIYKRMFAMNTEQGPLVLVNPRIIEVGIEKVVAKEGCLSIPNVYEPVERATMVKITAQRVTPAGVQPTETLEFHNFAARVVQHEIDHLDGKVFLTRVAGLRRKFALDGYKKFIKTTLRRRERQQVKKIREIEALARNGSAAEKKETVAEIEQARVAKQQREASPSLIVAPTAAEIAKVSR